MPEIIVHQEEIENAEEIIKICPFTALEIDDEGKVIVNAG